MENYPDYESTTLELKESLPKNEQLIKTAVAFCNMYGGRIVIGVRDDRKIVGVTELEADRLMSYLHMTIFESCTPPILPQIYQQRIEDKVVVVIDISSGMTKPYFITAQGLTKGTYLRLGRNTVRANSEVIEELKWQSRGRSADEPPVHHGTTEDLDTSKIADFLNQRKTASKSLSINESILKSYKIITEDQGRTYPTLGGLLCFAKQPQYFFSEAFIIVSHFDGISGRKVLATRDCSGRLFEQYEDAMNFIKSRLTRKFEIRGSKRTEQLEIPEVAIREIVLNAIVHRNYNLKSPSKIAIFDDRLEIFSPGLFAGPLSVKDLEKGLTYIRNTVVCKIFREAGYIEKLGSGFTTLFDSYAKAGLERPEIVEGENYVKCTLPRARLQAGSLPKSDQDRILELIERIGLVSISQVQSMLGVSRASAGRKLAKLVVEGKIKRIGKGAGSRYQI